MPITFPSNIADVIVADPVQDEHRERIVSAFTTAFDIIPENRRAEEEGRLLRSSVNSSHVSIAPDGDKIADLFSTVNDWSPVSETADTTIFQGTLPNTIKAYAAYEQVRNLFQLFGPGILSTLVIKAGRQQPGDLFLATINNCPTEIITVKLQRQQRGQEIEILTGWFAGRDLSTMVMDPQDPTGSQIVRCGVVLRPIDNYEANHNQRFTRKHSHQHHQGNRR